jgi:hypothetical protein
VEKQHLHAFKTGALKNYHGACVALLLCTALILCVRTLCMQMQQSLMLQQRAKKKHILLCTHFPQHPLSKAVCILWIDVQGIS